MPALLKLLAYFLLRARTHHRELSLDTPKMSNASRGIDTPKQSIRRRWAVSNVVLLMLVIVVAVLLVLNLLLLRPVTTGNPDQAVNPTLSAPDSDSGNY